MRRLFYPNAPAHSSHAQQNCKCKAGTLPSRPTLLHACSGSGSSLCPSSAHAFASAPQLPARSCPCAHPYAGLSLSTQNRLVCGVGRARMSWEAGAGVVCGVGSWGDKISAMQWKLWKIEKRKFSCFSFAAACLAATSGRVSKWRPLVAVWVDATVVRPPAWLWLAASATGGV